MLHYTLLATHTPVMPTLLFLYFCQPVKGPQPLAAGYTKNGEWVWGGRAAAEAEEPVRSGPAQSGPAHHHLCSVPRASLAPLFNSQQRRKCQSWCRPGNLHAQTRSFLSWHSSSCGLCKDFPAFHSLPVYVSLSHSFGWLPFGKLPQSNGLFFLPLCVHSGGVEACVSACVDAFCHYSTAAQPK